MSAAERERRDLLLAWVSNGLVQLGFLDSVVRCYETPALADRITGHLSCQSGPHLALARTRIARCLLDSSADWLLHLDSDMFFPPAAVLDLLAVADPVACPIVAGAFAGYVPATGEPPVLEYRALSSPDPDGLVDVEYVGAGFLLVHRRVFEELERRHPGPLPWFAEEVHDGIPDGEDWTFCRRARAAGIPVRVHTRVVVGHYKTVAVYPGRDPLPGYRQP